MTVVHFDMADPAGVPVSGYMSLVPTRRVTVGDEIRLPTALRVRLEAGEASVELMPSTTQWVWRVAELVPVGITRYVAIPDSDTVVEYAALESVDPSSLDVSSASVPAWEIATRTAQEMLDRVGEIDGKVERAEDAAAGAESSAGAAESHETAARSSADAAASSARDAASSVTAAASSAGSAASSASAAASSASGAASSAGEASGSAEAAAGSATAAALSASDAAAHAESARSSADAASVSATTAASSATEAAESVSTAASHATSAAQSATAAAKSAAEAAGSASTAESHAAEAASSASAAASSATTAGDAASAAAGSAEQAAASASAAASSETSAAGSASAAAGSAGSADASRISAADSASRAELMASRAEASIGALHVDHVATDMAGLPASGLAEGDIGLAGGVLYAWDGQTWIDQGAPALSTGGGCVWTGWQDPADLPASTVRDGDIWLQTPRYLTDLDPGNTTPGADTSRYYTYWEGEADNSPSVLVMLDQVATDLLVRLHGAWWSMIWRVGSTLTPGRDDATSAQATAARAADARLLGLETRIMALESKTK